MRDSNVGKREISKIEFLLVSVQPETRLKNIAISGTLLKASKYCGGCLLACMAGTEVKKPWLSPCCFVFRKPFREVFSE
jgi:hypothetical protein